MSNKLSTLVWGAKPFASDRGGLAQRLIMASLADQVDEVRHRDFCYPSFAVIGARTELSRRCVIDALGKLSRNGWLKVEQKPGYGNLYRFNTDKLAAHQREKRERDISRTRAYLAPVQEVTDRGASYADEGCNLALTNIEESALKPARQTSAPRWCFPCLRLAGNNRLLRRRNPNRSQCRKLRQSVWGTQRKPLRKRRGGRSASNTLSCVVVTLLRQLVSLCRQWQQHRRQRTSRNGLACLLTRQRAVLGNTCKTPARSLLLVSTP